MQNNQKQSSSKNPLLNKEVVLEVDLSSYRGQVYKLEEFKRLFRNGRNTSSTF